MRYRFSSMLTVAALALLGLTGCENAVHSVGPEPVAPSLSLETSSDSTLSIVEGPEETGGVTAMIGPDGGELKLGQQRLIVPAGAVDAPTEFRMKKSGTKMQVSLTATRVTTNDVGAAGFAKPLALIFSYGNAASLPADLSTLSVVWIRADGTLEAQPTTLDTTAKTVTGEITHFSDYAMASP